MSACTSATVPTPWLGDGGWATCGRGSGMVAVCSTAVEVRAGLSSSGCSLDYFRAPGLECPPGSGPAFCTAASIERDCGAWGEACSALGATDCVAEVDPVSGALMEIRPL